MENYIILINCEEQCIDMHCEFSYVNNFYTAEITDPFNFSVIIKEDCERQCYAEAAKYLLDKGKIISVAHIVEKHPFNFFSIYIRIEEINRHLTRFNKNSI